MRTSKDIYKLNNGKLMAFSQDVIIPKGAKIWSGYDYINQEWIFEGKKDTRTLEELRTAISIESIVKKNDDIIDIANIL